MLAVLKIKRHPDMAIVAVFTDNSSEETFPGKTRRREDGEKSRHKIFFLTWNMFFLSSAHWLDPLIFPAGTLSQIFRLLIFIVPISQIVFWRRVESGGFCALWHGVKKETFWPLYYVWLAWLRYVCAFRLRLFNPFIPPSLFAYNIVLSVNSHYIVLSTSSLSKHPLKYRSTWDPASLSNPFGPPNLTLSRLERTWFMPCTWHTPRPEPQFNPLHTFLSFLIFHWNLSAYLPFFVHNILWWMKVPFH